MKNKLDRDEDENSLEWARGFKPFLRWDYGDVVYIKSDWKKKNPMVIYEIVWAFNDIDYRLTWLNSQGTKEHASFLDKMLMQ